MRGGRRITSGRLFVNDSCGLRVKQGPEKIKKFRQNVIPAKAGIQKIHIYPMNKYYIYILASKRNGTLYCGVTNDIARRVYEHKNDFIKGFTERYKVHILVYYEIHDSILQAIDREKQIKEWKRKWKLQLIERFNPDWKDLYYELIKGGD